MPILRGCLPSTRRIDVLAANEVGASLWKFSLRRQEVKEMGRWGRRTEGKKVPGVMKPERGAWVSIANLLCDPKQVTWPLWASIPHLQLKESAFCTSGEDVVSMIEVPHWLSWWNM